MAHRKLPLPDGGNPGLRSRPAPRPPSDDSTPPPPLPSRRAPPPPPGQQRNQSVDSDDSEASFESDESYEQMHDNVDRPPLVPERRYRRQDQSLPPVPSDRRLPPAPTSRGSPSPPGPRKNTPVPQVPPARAKPNYPPPVLEPEPSQEIYDDAQEGDVYDDGTAGDDEPEELYTDGDVGEVYDDLEESSPSPPPPPPGRRAVPLPQVPSSSTQPKSATKPPPPPPNEESVYEVEPQISELAPSKEAQGGDIYDSVPDLPETQTKPQDKKLPPLPPVNRIPSQQSEEQQEEYDEFEIANTEDKEEDQEEYDAFEVGDEVQETYEAVDEPPPSRPSRTAPGAPPAPPAPVAPAAPPPPSRDAKRPPVPRPQKQDPPAPKPQASSGGLDLSAVLGARKNLRTVGKAPLEKQVSSESEKVYDESSDVQSAFAKFRQKGRPTPSVPNKPSSSSTSDDTDSSSQGGIKGRLAFLENKIGGGGVTPPKTALKPPTPYKPHDSSSAPPIPKDRVSPTPPSRPDRVSPTPHIHRTDELPPPPQSLLYRSRTPSPPPPVVPASDRPSHTPHSYTKVSPKTHNGTTQIKVEPEAEEDDDIYDDAMSHVDPLLKEPWYFKDLDRKDGERRLKNLNENGSFLIRDSSKGGKNQPYTMMVLYSGLIYNLKIRERDDGKVALGEEKSDEMAFIDVKEMVQYHRENDVILVHNGKQNQTLLKQSPRK